MITIIPKWIWKRNQEQIIYIFVIIMAALMLILDGASKVSIGFLVIAVICACFNVVRMYRLRQNLKLEFGDGKIVIRHITKDAGMIFPKACKDTFTVNELQEYGFSKDVLGKNMKEHKIVGLCYIAERFYFDVSREIVFVLKDGRKSFFESMNFAPEQLHDLAVYIESCTGITPKGMLGVSLLTNKFTDEQLEIVFDEMKFDEAKIGDVELELPKCKKYFAKEAVIIRSSGQVVYILYDKIRAITYFVIDSSRNPFGPQSGCFFWLKSGMKYRSQLGSVKDFEKISKYILKYHSEIEVVASSIF